MNKICIGIDIGGTNIRIGHGRKGAPLLGYQRVPRTQVLTGENAVANVAAFIQQYIQRFEIKQCDIQAIGIGLPSVLSADRRMVLQTPNIPGMDQIALAKELEERLQLPVYLERDTNLLFLCDSYGMTYSGAALGIYIGTGLGNALFFAGTPYIGFNGAAAELGHIPLRGNRLICGCGNEGCAETLASGAHLYDLQRTHYPQTEMENLFVVHKDEAVLQQFVDDIAMVVATEINILDPEFVILGGGVLDMKDFPKEYIISRIHHYCRKPYPEKNLRLLFSKESQHSGVRGAIIYATNKELEEVKC